VRSWRIRFSDKTSGLRPRKLRARLEPFQSEHFMKVLSG
jgi:hypothetical protein